MNDQLPTMSGHEFAGWISKLCVLEQSGISDVEFIDNLRSFAAECGVEVNDADLAAYFQFDEIFLRERL